MLGKTPKCHLESKGNRKIQEFKEWETREAQEEVCADEGIGEVIQSLREIW